MVKERVYCIKDCFNKTDINFKEVEDKIFKAGEWYFLEKSEDEEGLFIYYFYDMVDDEYKFKYAFSSHSKAFINFITLAEWRNKQLNEILNG